MNITPELSPEDIASALKIAREFIDAGIPVFAAAPQPDKPGQYYLPREWEKTVPDPVWLDKWRPGWALGAVGGGPADFLDFDPRNGGDQSLRELEIQGQLPRVFGVQGSPSGGTHLVISPTGERKATGFMPGVDLLAGQWEPDEYGGHGRGFIYIAPTVRPSKAPETLGQLRAYRWEQLPDLAYLAEFRPGSDDSQDGILARVHAWRSSGTKKSFPSSGSGTPSGNSPGLDPLFRQGGTGPRLFTEAEAREFCLPHLEALQHAPIGQIEESANRAAVALAHFVPAVWPADFAFDVLSTALSATAYDPTHPASGWTAEKFRAVLDGRRPPLDGWKAVRKVTPREAAAAFGAGGVQDAALPAGGGEADAMVEALLAEMLSADQLAQRPAPEPLIEDLLNLDSIAWLIGAPGSKKSFVALDMAAHVARGLPWQGLRVTQGPTVLIVAEGAGGMSTRVRAWQQAHGSIGGVEVFRVLPRPVQVTDAVGWQVLVEACRRIKPVLVVIDTQARVTVGMEENSAKEMGQFVEAAERVRQATGACVAVVHHTGRNGADARGSSAIDGAQSTELKVVRQDGLTGVLKVEKQKDLEEMPDMPLFFERVVVGQDERGKELSSLVLVEPNAFRRAEGSERQGPRVYVPTFDDRDVWRQRILDALYLHAPEGGWLLSDLVGRLAVDYGLIARSLRTSGAFTGAWKAVLELRDDDGEPVIARPSPQRFEVGSLSARAGLRLRYPDA